MFAVVFGLSMDYEVFLISRIREEWVRRHDASEAVAEGIAVTGRVISAAAAIMICVFLSFTLGNERTLKEFGFGLAVAVFVDAIIVRCLLLPATPRAARPRHLVAAAVARRAPAAHQHRGLGGASADRPARTRGARGARAGAGLAGQHRAAVRLLHGAPAVHTARRAAVVAQQVGGDPQQPGRALSLSVRKPCRRSNATVNVADARSSASSRPTHRDR